MKGIIWFVFLLIIVCACLDEPDCFRVTNNQIGIVFRVLGSTRADSIPFEGLTISGANGVFDINQQTGLLNIPLNIAVDESNILFIDSAGSTRFLNLAYFIQRQFVNDECGPKTNIINIRPVDSNFDSVRLVDGNAGAGGITNIELFRCPRTNIAGLAFYQLLPVRSGTRSNSASIEYSSIESGSGYASGEDSLSLLFFPVDIGTQQTDLVFNVTNGFSRNSEASLELSYITTDEERFKGCGVQTFVSELRIAASSFDSVSIARSVAGEPINSLRDPLEVNINVYSCPKTNIVQIDFKRPASNALDTVAIKSIRANYTSDIWYENTIVRQVQLPLNENNRETTFYIDYGLASDPVPRDRDTVSLTYTTTPTVFYSSCGEQLTFSELVEAPNNPDVSVLPDIPITYPPRTNLEIIH